MEIFIQKRILAVSAAILFVAVTLCVGQSSVPMEVDCSQSLFNLAARSRALCLDESRGLTTTEAPTTPAEEDDVDALFEDNEAEPAALTSDDATSPTPESSTRPSRRRMRNKTRRQSRRMRMQLFKECFHREMSAHPMAEEIMDSCADQVAHRNPTVEEKREQKCFINTLSRECPGILGFGRGRRPNRFRNF